LGVFNGSVSLTKFYVRGNVPKRFAQPFMTKIDLHRFVELEADDEQGESSGWCVAGQPLDLGLHQEQVILHGYVVLALRVDRWRIPRPQFKAQVEEAVAMWRERTGREKISKKDKDELKFRVERKLRKKVLPRMRHYDMCWNVDTGTVLLWSRSPRVKEDFRELFEKTFELELDEDSPYMAAKRLQPAAADALSELQPSFPVDEVD
jgi:hypothetical protein